MSQIWPPRGVPVSNPQVCASSRGQRKSPQNGTIGGGVQSALMNRRLNSHHAGTAPAAHRQPVTQLKET
jgi:hypothetical protein